MDLNLNRINLNRIKYPHTKPILLYASVIQDTHIILGNHPCLENQSKPKSVMF